MLLLWDNSKYSKWYCRLIDNAKNRVLPVEVYTEKHHIIPRSLGGSNDEENLAVLTAREHFIAHLLLYKCVVGTKAKHKMGKALHKMYQGHDGKRYKNNRFYEMARIAAATAISAHNTGKSSWNKGLTKHTDVRVAKLARPNPKKGFKKGYTPWNTGLTNIFSEEATARKSAAMKGNKHSAGKTMSLENKRLKSIAFTGDKNPAKRPENREKIRKSKVGKKRIHNIELNTSKFVNGIDINIYLEQGWQPGALPKNKKG